ncbi:MAG: hypothetical protein JKY15_06590 [Deltaproteobacteria bacterium]|nr:hypothetical protein [Deltaproteobacteria bacterium]
MKIKFVILSLIVSFQVNAIMSPIRCYDRLTEAEAIERWAWAEKCFPDDLHIKFKNFHEGTYPEWGCYDESKGRINPKNWVAPTDREAPCTVPEGYVLLTFCLMP